MLAMKHNRDQKAENDPRQLSLLAIDGVLEKGAYTNIILDQYLRKTKLLPSDRHLVTEIVNGTIRMLKHLDWVLNLFLTKPVDKQNPWLKNALRMSLYQMLFMERIPDYACVNSAVDMVRDRAGTKLAGVANGVMRNIARNRDEIKYPQPLDSIEYLAVYYSQPEWLAEKLLYEYGLEASRKILAYYNRRPALILRNNSLLGSREELLDILRKEGLVCEPSNRTPWGIVVSSSDKSLAEIDAYQKGRFYVQNEASMLVVSVLDPQEGEHIIDLGCGVGGKTSFIAEQMNNTGSVVAYDSYDHKLTLLESNCSRLGISVVRGHNQDILDMDEGNQQFTGVLLDAPCSGLGVLNRRADARWRKNPASIAELGLLQIRLLKKAAFLVAEGGRLVYSTCTINREENEEIVGEFLRTNPHFTLEGFDQNISYFPLDSRDKGQATTGMLTVLPGKYETDGMFYALMRRITS